MAPPTVVKILHMSVKISELQNMGVYSLMNAVYGCALVCGYLFHFLHPACN